VACVIPISLRQLSREFRIVGNQSPDYINYRVPLASCERCGRSRWLRWRGGGRPHGSTVGDTLPARTVWHGEVHGQDRLR
jgi:hypothetical protein